MPNYSVVRYKAACALFSRPINNKHLRCPATCCETFSKRLALLLACLRWCIFIAQGGTASPRQKLKAPDAIRHQELPDQKSDLHTSAKRRA